ncbi:hypothetical protein Tco_0417627, partial [Tanacetum coccineum]
LVPSCCVIFDLEPLSLSFDFVMLIRDLLNLFLVCLCHHCHLAILYLDQHAHTLHHLESLLTISRDNLCLDNLDIFKEDLEYQSCGIIMEYLVNISKRRAFWSLNEDILKITILKTNTPYPSRKIRRIRACTHQRPQRKEDQYAYDEYIHDLRFVETEFPAIAFNDEVPSEKTLSCEPTVSSLNDEIYVRVSSDDSDDEDYTVIFDKNSFSYKTIYTNDLKTDSKNDNEKVNLPSLLSPEPMISCFDDLDFFKDFENVFPTIVYNDAQISKSVLLTGSILSPQHIDEFNLKYETSLSECDEEEQNILNFNDLFPFNVIYPNDSKSDKDNDDDKVDIEHSSEDLSVKPLPDVINTDVGAYAHGSNKLLETSINTTYPWDLKKEISTNVGGEFKNLEDLEVLES